MCQELRWLVNLEKSGPQTSIRLRRLTYRPNIWPGPAHTGPVADPPTENTGPDLPTNLSGLAVHVVDRSADSYRETSSPWPTTHETNSMAPQKQLESTRITRKGDPYPQVLAPPSEMVAGRRQCASRSAITPTKTCSASLYRRIKRRVGRSLKQTHGKGKLVPSRKQAAYELPGTEDCFLSPKRFPRPLLRKK